MRRRCCAHMCVHVRAWPDRMLPTHPCTGSQLQNKGVAVKRLRLALATRVRTQLEIGAAWVPGHVLLSKLGRKGGIEVGPGHADLPVVLADLLDGIFWVTPLRRFLGWECGGEGLVGSVGSVGSVGLWGSGGGSPCLCDGPRAEHRSEPLLVATFGRHFR